MSTPANYPSDLGDHAVFTYFFYWYDTETKTHLGPHGPSLTDDPLTDEPPDTPAITWRGTAWFKNQIEDMIYAGVDVILPVYWRGECCEWWSRPGINNLATALEEVRLSGKTPPAVAMFYDLTSAEDLDLTNKADQDIIYQDISFFYKSIPHAYWARTSDNRPIIWLWSGVEKYKSSFFNFITEDFKNEFSEIPFIVFGNVSVSNDPEEELKGYDALAPWNGQNPDSSSKQIFAISPGMDDRWILSRGNTTFIDRQNGDYYRQGWAKAILCKTPWVTIETWNEFHEATDIAETKQYGRKYLDITHELSPYFKQGILPDNLRLTSEYSGKNSVDILMEDPIKEDGINILPSMGDGRYEAVTESGQSGVRMQFNDPNAGGYLYFMVDDGFYFNQHQKIEVNVTYFDEGYGQISLEYDKADCASDWNPDAMFALGGIIQRGNTKTWKTATIVLSDATFVGHENGGADFRLGANNGQPALISSVQITKVQE